MSGTQSFLESLEWRRAVKHFGEGPVDTQSILTAMMNAPSSFGIQPYKILVIQDKDLKQKLSVVSYNQPQVTECHTLFILCARKDVETRAEEYLTATQDVSRGMRDMLMGFISYLPDKLAWASRQAYIALGFGLAAAAEQRIASCPMEGFNPEEVRKLLELPENLVPVVYLAVGATTEKDGVYPRFRFSESDLVQRF